ncbi:ABC transporter substrate-binding protein (plasmid) [Rhizobium leguminosarum bv. trifolii]|uniref:ABC transporter substrate-binding protein n=1 Tax=Rhizobium ruizarguesonis TaxID=2081791 RepID=UPI001031AEC5|nr:ABC transporter substrate-binding protein [Rhizobium ruizarguesonis]MBY5886710.1 ABC transporter substrate-binding protein [Rhizobium leguminosarum]NKL13520.1 ABC transporter substrate-binding protein [Rhizobium leguminosarum bv. viciae]QIO47942.1 ABC transporter substrate-binding protein [Rhizobium leguminosarum bv. trifolii]NEI96778.1 ABC transporter substrate-binding protein [Rhizobium ruizarguesonis]NEJ33599.1 ABC transporter substrate-binding protein [Rhizobium ruizarguesonis]
MTSLKSLMAACGLSTMIGLAANPSLAGSATYPLTLENCGAQVTFQKAPERAIGLGQNSAEILLLLGLQDKMAGTAFWPSKVLPQLAEANAKVKLLTVEMPTFESILAENPDFVAAALPSLVGPNSKVAKREDFDKVGVATYLSPSTCLSTKDVKDQYGSRAELWNMDLLYREIDELSQIFDVADRGQTLIADFKAREAKLRSSVSKDGKNLSYVFWFSSPSPSADAYLGGKNSASGFIADLLGGHNAISAEAEWPTLGWEGIIASNPDVIVVASLDRNRWELDKPEAKINFLNTDPAVSQIPAVKNKTIVIMDGQAMNPTVRTVCGAEQVAGQLKALGLLK